VATEIVVIGAGAVGGSTALRLAQGGARVTLLDAGQPGHGTSGSSFAWTNSCGKTPRHYHDLNVEGMREHAVLSQELQGDWYHPGGNVEWKATDEARAALRKKVDLLIEWGYDARWISQEQLRELEPGLRFDPEQAREIVFYPEEGWVNGRAIARGLAAAVERAGGTVLLGQRVTAIDTAGGSIAGVVAGDGRRIAADVVVTCAGPRTAEVARLAGAEVPMANTLGLLALTSGGEPVTNRVIHAPACHVHPYDGGAAMLHIERYDHSVTRDTVPDVSLEGCRVMFDEGVGLFPALAGRGLAEARIGERPIPKDGLPAVGKIGADGHYVVVTHSGITLGPILGRTVAAEILTGTPDPRLEPFRPDRFPKVASAVPA
jgi:glycine/D-amino acid oxidase-like deaminating enzyme